VHALLALLIGTLLLIALSYLIEVQPSDGLSPPALIVEFILTGSIWSRIGLTVVALTCFAISFFWPAQHIMNRFFLGTAKSGSESS